MTDTQIETADRGYDRLWEVAHASKDERCMAVASKLVDTLLEPYEDPEYRPDLQTRAEIAGELLGVYANYPEAFSRLHETGKVIDDDAMLALLPKILKYGGLPLVHTEYDYRRATVEELEETAEIRETIAAALFDTPPNEAFIRDFNLTLLRGSTKNPVDLIVSKLNAARDYEQQVESQKRSTKDEWSRYEQNEGKDTTKLKTIVYKIENVSLELRHHPAGDEFKVKMEIAFNNPETTLRDLEELWKEGRSLIVAGFQARAEENQRAYDLVINGGAAIYTSPVPE